MGETGRSLKARFDEHRRPSSSTSEVSRHIHNDCKGHTVHIEKAKILTVKPNGLREGLKRLSIYEHFTHHLTAMGEGTICRPFTTTR